MDFIKILAFPQSFRIITRFCFLRNEHYKIIYQEELLTMTTHETWNCQNCGKKEISSNFCPECGTKKPDFKENLITPTTNNKQFSQKIIDKLAENKKTVFIVAGVLVVLIICLTVINGQLKQARIEEETKKHEELKQQEEVERLKQELAQEKEARQQQEIERLKQELAQKEKEENIRKEEKNNATTKLQKRKNKQWSSKSPNAMNWNKALDYCKNLSENGHNDWHLPTISELRTIIKNCEGPQTGGSCKLQDNSLSRDWWNDSCHCTYKKNNSGYYSKLGDDDKISLWSSSTRSDRTSNAWNVNFASAYIDDSRKGKNNYVRCVR